MTTQPTDTEFAHAIEDFKGGGWIVSVLGGAGMLARLLLDDERHPAVFWIRRLLAGSIVAVICYFGISLSGSEITGFKRAFLLCTAGAFSPELMELSLKQYKKGLDEKNQKRKRNKRNKA